MDQLLAKHLSKFDLAGDATEILQSLCGFIEDRLTVQMREQGIAHDVLSAVLYKNGLVKGVSLVNVAARAIELNGLVKSEQGESLVAGYRRAANILRAEEKKDGRSYRDEVDHKLFKTDDEEKLATAIEVVNEAVAANIAAEDFATAINELSSLRAPRRCFLRKRPGQ